MPNESSRSDGLTGVPIGDAAEHLGISVETLRKRLQRGRQEGYKDQDGTWRVLIALPEPDPAPSPAPAMIVPALPPKPAAPAPELLSHIAALTAEIQALRHETAAQRHKLDYLSAQVAQMDADNQDQLAALQALILSVEAEVSARDDDKASRLRKKLKPVLLMIVDLLQRRRQAATLAPYEPPPPVPPVLPAALSSLPTAWTPGSEEPSPEDVSEPIKATVLQAAPEMDSAPSPALKEASERSAPSDQATDWDLPFDGTEDTAQAEEVEAGRKQEGAAFDAPAGEATDDGEPDFDISSFLVDAPDPLRPEEAPFDGDAPVDDHLDPLPRAEPVNGFDDAIEMPIDGDGSTAGSHLDTLLEVDTDDLDTGAAPGADPPLDTEPVTAESLGIENLADLLASEPGDLPEPEPDSSEVSVETPDRESEDGLQVIEEGETEDLDISKFLVDAPDPTMPGLDELLAARDTLDVAEHEEGESELEVIEEEAPEDLDISKLLSPGPDAQEARPGAVEPLPASPPTEADEDDDSFEPPSPVMPPEAAEDVPTDFMVDAPGIPDDVADTEDALPETDDALDLAAFLSGDPQDEPEAEEMPAPTSDDVEPHQPPDVPDIAPDPLPEADIAADLQRWLSRPAPAEAVPEAPEAPSEDDVSPAAAAAALLGIAPVDAAPADPWALEPDGDDSGIPLLDEDDPFSLGADPGRPIDDATIPPAFGADRGLEAVADDADPDATLVQSRAASGLDTASLLSRLDREEPPIAMEEDDILDFEAPEDDGHLPEWAKIDDPWEPETPPKDRSDR